MPILRARLRLMAPLLAGAAALVAGCSKEEPQAQPPRTDSVIAGEEFHPPNFNGERTRDTTLAGMLLRGVKADYVVLSLAPDSTRPAAARADLLQIFHYDSTARVFRLALVDTLRWITARELRDLTGDGAPEAIMTTDAGGNDAVATRGLAIYSGTGGGMRVLFRVNHGDPELRKLDGRDGECILLHNELWPQFASHAEAVEYLDDVLAWRNGSYTSIRSERTSLFTDQAATWLEEYKTLRVRYAADTLQRPDSLRAADTLTHGEGGDSMPPGAHPLFMRSALVIISYGRGVQSRSVRSFWGSEAEYLRRRIPPEQFDELEAIYERVMAP